MARPAKVKLLPPDVLDDLNARLIGQGFAGYDALAEWLQAKGFDISRATLQRHGSALEAEFEEAMADARRTRALARAARESGGDEDGSLMSAAASILQDNLLRVSLAVKRDSEDDPAAAAKTLSLISRAFADVGRMDIANQKWMAETRAKLDVICTKGGVTEETKLAIRAALGIT